MPTVPVNGVRLHYEQAGQGPALLMVHGLAANLAFWYLRSAPFLKQDFRVTAYDLRGHGRSEMTPAGYTVASLADDLGGLADGLGIERAHVVGHSFGGLVALEYALRAPERVLSLTIADSRIQALQPARRLRDWPHFDRWRREVEASGAAAPDAEEAPDYELLSEELGDGLEGRLAVAGGGPIAPRRDGHRGRRQWLRLLESTTARTDFRDPGPGLDRIRTLAPPTLAVFGERSHCMPTCWRLRAAVGCRVAIVPGAGHFFPLTRPRAFVEPLRAFLLGRSRPRRPWPRRAGGPLGWAARPRPDAP